MDYVTESVNTAVVGNEKVMRPLSAVAGEKNYDVKTPFFPQFCGQMELCTFSANFIMLQESKLFARRLQELGENL